MASKKPRLKIARATRVDYATAVELLWVSGDTGLVTSQVDREILTRVAELLRAHWMPGLSLKHWVKNLSYVGEKK